MNYLPPEVLAKIFSYISQKDLLTSVSRVSSFIKDVIFSTDLWIILDLSKSTEEDLEIHLENMIYYEDFVQHLLIKSEHLQKIFDLRHKCIFPNLKNLQIINYLPGKEIEFCYNVIRQLPRLTSIRVRMFRSAEYSACLLILSKLELTHFDICISRGALKTNLNKSLCDFVLAQNQLKSLSVHSLDLYAETFFTFLNLTNLTYLNISNSGDGGNSFDFFNLQELPQLTALDLTATSVDDENLKSIVTKTPNLQRIDLLFCKNLSDVGILSIASYCHNLEVIMILNVADNISGISLSESTMVELGKGCRKLTQLTASCCSALNDAGVVSLAENCKNLEFVEIQNDSLSTTSLDSFTKFCKHLFHLEISGDDFKAESIAHLLKSNTFLKYLKIGSCPDFGSIDFSECTTSGEKTIKGLLKNHSHVQTVDMEGEPCDNLKVLVHFVTFCPDLRRLSLPLDVELNFEMSFKVFRKCRFLKTITLDRRTYERE